MTNFFNIRHGILLSVLGLVTACTTDPHIEDWQRDRITEIPKEAIEVAICFDMKQHSKDLVYGLAKDECGVRIREVQNLILHAGITQGVARSTHAEGQVFQGPVQREKQLKAMLGTLQLKYLENDKWECPLATPNRITFECQYDPNARDSVERRQVPSKQPVSPDLPPELPDDLKPQ